MEENKLNSQINLQKKLEAIGASLYEIRTAKGISLDELAANTLIAKRLLIAIETGNIKELPESFYTQALINKIARAIGAEQSNVELNLILSENHAVSKSSSSTKITLPKKLINFNFQLRSLHLYLIYIFLVIVSVKGIATLVERPVVVYQLPDDPPSLDTQVTDFNASSQSIQPQSMPQLISQATDSQTVMVGINLEARCWLKVMVDGKIAFEGTLPKGTQRTWTGKEQITIRAGNAGGVAVTFNNGQKQLLGKPGQVEEVTYTLN